MSVRAVREAASNLHCLTVLILANVLAATAGAGEFHSGYQAFEERYAAYQQQVAEYEAWQVYDAELAAYDVEYEERCRCICDRRDFNGNRVQFATCCVANPSASTCTNEKDVCRDLTICDTAYEYERIAPRATADRVCTRLTICSADEYELTPPTASSDRVCAPLSTACPIGLWERVPQVYTQDRQCFQPTMCAPQQYRARYATATSDTVCSAVTVCAVDEFEVLPPTALSDRLCQKHRVCGLDEYELDAPTAVKDRVCTMLTVCDANECVLRCQSLDILLCRPAASQLLSTLEPACISTGRPVAARHRSSDIYTLRRHIGLCL